MSPSLNLHAHRLSTAHPLHRAASSLQGCHCLLTAAPAYFFPKHCSPFGRNSLHCSFLIITLGHLYYIEGLDQAVLDRAVPALPAPCVSCNVCSRVVASLAGCDADTAQPSPPADHIGFAVLPHRRVQRGICVGAGQTAPPPPPSPMLSAYWFFGCLVSCNTIIFKMKQQERLHESVLCDAAQLWFCVH